MEVRSLTSAEEFKRYIDFGNEVYRSYPSWVPPDAHHLSRVLSGEGGFGPQSQIQPFWVEEDGRVLATVTAFTDEVYNRHWNEPIGHLLFFEALAEQNEAVELLMSMACQWLRDRGCNAARLSLLPGMQLPLSIDAYDDVPTVFHTYNPNYYHSFIKNSGFVTDRGVVQYQVEFNPELARRYKEMVERASGSGVTLRSWDLDQLEKETEAFMNIGNETFKAHWGFMPLTKEVYNGLTHGLKDFLISDFMLFAEIDGQVVGFVYSLPDLNQALHRVRGKNLEENFSEFQQYLNEIDHGVLLIIGVLESHRGQGVNLALAAKSYLAMIERGYKTASYTVVMDDNWPSRRTAEKLGARVTRNFNVYRKDLGR
ncbi:MAG TPA: GNAT family N-acetyltransferase [Pyrinomonadaceae bacterium]|nr:GNAT family N-acetyltransferase [Pyrinomonadaceae bacterium]